MNDTVCETCQELRAKCVDLMEDVQKRDAALRDHYATKMACPNPGLYPTEAYRLGWAHAIAKVVAVIRGN